MAPVAQYVFAETPGISGRFTAGRHECLPYSVFPTFSKQTNKQQFVAVVRGLAEMSHFCIKNALPGSGGHFGMRFQTLTSGPLMDLTTGSPRVSTLESLIRCLGQTVAHMPQLSHLE